MRNGLFTLHAPLSRKQKLILQPIGYAIFFIMWQVVYDLELVQHGLFPSPLQTLQAFPEMFVQNHLLQNAIYSLQLNVAAFLIAVPTSFVVGMLIALVPVVRGLFEVPIMSLRYLPLTAAIGIFMSWFGAGSLMKMCFLAFCLFVYMVLAVSNRIDEVMQNRKVLLDSGRMLGGTPWQLFRHIYFPAAMPNIWVDITSLVAISFTYLIAAESINMGDGGVGALMVFFQGRQHRVDKLFAGLALIGLFALVFDKSFRVGGKLFFPSTHKTVQPRWRRAL